MQHLKLVKKIVDLLNHTFPPKDVVCSHFEYGKHVVDKIVKIKPYFTATYDKAFECKIWVNDYYLFRNEEVLQMVELIKQATIEQQLNVSLQYIYVATADTAKKPANILIK